MNQIVSHIATDPLPFHKLLYITIEQPNLSSTQVIKIILHHSFWIIHFTSIKIQLLKYLFQKSSTTFNKIPQKKTSHNLNPSQTFCGNKVNKTVDTAHYKFIHALLFSLLYLMYSPLPAQYVPFFPFCWIWFTWAFYFIFMSFMVLFAYKFKHNII